MALTISEPVGQGGKNLPKDVRVVQELLNKHANAAGFPTLALDSKLGPATQKAISAFQRSIGLTADGRVDPGGATLRALSRPPAPKKDKSEEPKEKKSGRLTGASVSGVDSSLVAVLEAVAAFYGRDIRINSGKRSAAKQADAMFKNWVATLKRGKRYKALMNDRKTLVELDTLWSKAVGETKVSSKEADAAHARFLEICTANAAKLSYHLVGKALDVHAASMTMKMRDAVKACKIYELPEGACYHYDLSVGAPLSIDEAKKKWRP